MTRAIKWTEDMGEERLWVCEVCGAELDADCVGDHCPACGDKIADENSPETGSAGASSLDHS